MNTELTITPVGIADINTLHQLSRKTFLDSFAHLNTPENMEAYLNNNLTKETLTAEINNPDSAFYFACLVNKPIGYIKLNTGQAQNELKDENGLEIERIYVDKDHQGKKVGQLLFNYATDLAKQANRPHIWLGVWSENYNAIRFYERHGFVKFGSHPFMLGDDKQTDSLMILTL